MKFRIHHTPESKRDPYDVEGIRIEHTSSGYDLILSEEREGSMSHRRVQEVPRDDIHLIEGAPDEDLAQAIADYRRLSEVLVSKAPPKWQKFASLREEYRRLQDLEGYTPQSRGRRLNGFLVDLLDCWEINAVESARSYGEIDVAFRIEDVPYLMEKKWEQEPLNFDPITKLNTRVKQRLVGTLGVLLSMSGYTRDALRRRFAPFGGSGMIACHDNPCGCTRPRRAVAAGPTVAASPTPASLRRPAPQYQ
jgi:hypothetical protein